MVTDLDTLATALYVTCDDLLKAHPERRPPRLEILLQCIEVLGEVLVLP